MSSKAANKRNKGKQIAAKQGKRNRKSANNSTALKAKSSGSEHAQSAPEGAKLRRQRSNNKRVAVHVCRFIEYTPSAIVAAHLHPDNKHCAIGRKNGNIEIWDLRGSFIQRILPGQGQDTVHSLLWINDFGPNRNKLRLVSSGFHGWINEWDLESLSIKSKMSAQGFAVWDIAQCAIKNPDTDSYEVYLSAACDDGMLRIYRLEVDRFMFQCQFHLPHTKTARCMSTCWAQSAYPLENCTQSIQTLKTRKSTKRKVKQMVFGGTSNGLVLGFDFVSRQQMVTIEVSPVQFDSVRRKSAAKPGITALCALPDRQLAVGSTRGNIDIYDAKFGTLIERNNMTQHEVSRLQYVGEDVANGRNDILIASCVDGRVLQLIRKNKEFTTPMLSDDQQFTEKMTKQTEFVMTGYHRYHTHDVNVVTATDEKVVSGGNDCQLVSCGTKDFWTHYICSPLANATDSKIVQIADNVEWIGDVLPVDDMEVDTDSDTVANGIGDGDESMGTALSRKLFLHQKVKTLELWYLHREHPIKVMEISVGFKEHSILCSAISNDGKWICAATNRRVKCWRICIEEKAVKLKREFECSARGASTITFTKDGGHLLITPTISDAEQGIDDDDEKVVDSQTTDVEGKAIGTYLDSNKDDNAQIVRIQLCTASKSKKKGLKLEFTKIDKMVTLKEIGNHLISSLKLNSDSTLCAITVPSLQFGAVVHMQSGRLFYGIPRRSGCNISCIEFQRTVDPEQDNAAKEVVFVVYADNAIKMFQFDSFADPKRLLSESRNVRLHEWVGKNSKIWETYNGNNPFSFTHILFNEAQRGKALMVRPEYMFSMQIHKTLPSVYCVGVGMGRGGPSGKRLRIDQMIASPFGKPEGGGDGAGDVIGRGAKKKKRKPSVLRVIRKYDPIVFAQFISENALLLVHAPWERVSSKFADPAFRKLYAS